jgi:hypothetical protein
MEVSKWYNPIGTTNDAEVKSVSLKDTWNYGIACGVCGEFVKLNPIEARHVTFMLCPECIKAIKFAKTLMKNNPNMNIDGYDGK